MSQIPGDPERRQLPLGDRVNQLAEGTSTLVRQELELAKAVMTQKGKKAGLGLGQLGGAGIVALYALGALTACLILALSTAMAGWLAALIVTVAYLLIAGGLAATGRTRVRKAAPSLPEETIRTVKEDVQWAKHPTRSAGR